MSIFMNLLFLHGHLVDPREVERSIEAERLASRDVHRERRFAAPGTARRDARRVARAPVLPVACCG